MDFWWLNYFKSFNFFSLYLSFSFLFGCEFFLLIFHSLFVSVCHKFVLRLMPKVSHRKVVKVLSKQQLNQNYKLNGDCEFLLISRTFVFLLWLFMSFLQVLFSLMFSEVNAEREKALIIGNLLGKVFLTRPNNKQL